MNKNMEKFNKKHFAKGHFIQCKEVLICVKQ